MKRETESNLIKASNALDVGVMILKGFEATKKSLDVRYIKAQQTN